MKLRIVLIFLMLAASLSLLSCIVTSRDINVDISCDEFRASNHARNDFQVEIGDKIRAKLCSNPTTGFKWEYEMSNEAVLNEEDYDFEEPKSNVPGASGIEVWTFEAVEKGTTEVRMEYSQPWEGGLKKEWTYTMTVTVE
ncbi:protease inhibitor I42 family protein [Chloroflexota bacterium]|jgi:predicted secreted protein